jgi:dimethylamine/trimethylamine dehydrogenase
MDARYAALFEPVRLGPKVLPNRFYQVPHASAFGAARPRAHAAFRAIKAEGGWGAVCTDYAPVSPDSDESPFVASDCWSEQDMTRLGMIAQAVHQHGALAGIELYHGGSSSINGESRLPAVAPNQRRGMIHGGSMARDLDQRDFARITADFVTAAVRARDVGFDIVYIYGAHGYLMTQMLSPVTNERTDGYGGSLANRARFQRETLEAVRHAVGDDVAIAVRTAIGPGRGLPGIDTQEMAQVIELLDPLVDLWDVNVGDWPEDSGTSRYFPEGHQLPVVREIRSATAKPIVGVGRFTSPDVMAAAIRSGTLDIIGAARPAIADPFLPTKIREGRQDEIRECTGSNICILREEKLRQIGCFQNPTAGEEFRRGWHPEQVPPAADPSTTVLVVGAGAAGMECAITLARRGFEGVHLVEASASLGGRLSWMRTLPGLGDWGRVIDHRLVALSRLKAVSVVTGRRLSVDDVLDYGAQVVVVAAGSSWEAGGVQPVPWPQIHGAEFALTPEAVMAGARPAAGHVVVYDAEGYVVGPGMAELLRSEGFTVSLVTPHPVVSPVSDGTLEGAFLRQHLHDLGISMHTDVVLLEVATNAVQGSTGVGDSWTLDRLTGVVLVTQQRSERSLYDELMARPQDLADAGITAVHLIGDALAPRLPSEAVFDGHRLAREIDQPEPMAPAAWTRER